MPAKNAIKQYLENGYYHLYNRGVEKRIIFLDHQDYAVFLSYLKEYLLPKNEDELKQRLLDSSISYPEKNQILKKLHLNNFSQEITLLAYCLMPNHFHFFIKQTKADSINKFMRSLCTRYVMYFNKKYKRVGSLFQAVYKAVLVESDEQFVYLSSYIHKQALSQQGESLLDVEIQPCSYFDYIGKRKTEWVKPDEVLAFFSKEKLALSYPSFVKRTDNFDPTLLETDE